MCVCVCVCASKLFPNIIAYSFFVPAYLSCDGSVEGRQLFLSVNKSAQASSSSSYNSAPLHHVPNCNSDIDTATISLVVQPIPDSVLVQVAKTKVTTAAAFDYTRQDSFEAEIELRKSEPLPFSSKRSMFSTGKVAQVQMYTYMYNVCLLYTSPSPRDATLSRMPSSA